MVTIPKQVNPHRIARQSGVMHGGIPLDGLERINDICLQDDAHLVDIDLRFAFDKKGVCFIEGTLAAKVKLNCQRCMQTMLLPLETKFTLSPMTIEQSTRDNLEYDMVRLDGEKVALHDMIEDEILLSIPDFPKHGDLDCLSYN